MVKELNKEPEFELNPTGTEEVDKSLEIQDIGIQQQNIRDVLHNEEDAYLQQRNDPRANDEWGVKGHAKEAQSILSGGLRDTFESVTQFPERTFDALSGEMKREKEDTGTYQPEFTPFVDPENPIITKTWWGQLARGTVHFGSLALGTILTAKALGVTAPVWLTGMAGYGLLRAAGIGAISDLISKESDGHNALGVLRDRYGLIDTPLSTKDTDHPIMMKLKNIVEGMGIGVVFDGAAMLIGKGSRGVRNKVLNRTQSIDSQQLKSGLKQLRENQFRADKNRPMAAAHQGAHLSEDDPFVVWERLKRNRNEWGSEDGHAGSITTAVGKERAARSYPSFELVDSTLKKLLSNSSYQEVIASTKGSRKRLIEVFGEAVEAHQRITQGRNPADMPAEEYLQELFDVMDVYDKGSPDEIATITSRNIVVTDLLVGTLLQEIEARGIGARELAGFADLKSIDGPADQIMDTLFTALTEVKRARIMKSANFREIGAGKKRAYVNETLAKEMNDTRESIQTILNIAKGEDGEELLMALFEAFSMMKTVNSLDDFDMWARKMIKGGEIEGKVQIGALVRGLQEMAINSILSSPKTPLRAIMGTSTATFLRPTATVLGGVMRYPFTGDSTTVRAGLSSLYAMMEAIPESFELFKTKLNAYWSGDISTIKTRFAEYTRNDDNWEIIRRWAESDRATLGDKIWFKFANQIRAWNDSSFLSYSTKLMAATDDSFRFILGRAKMREKALRSALDAQSKGVLTAYTDITPRLIRTFENDFHSQVFNADGSLKDEATKFAAKEVTLTKEMRGMAAGLNAVFNANPLVKPFFYFARTGVNGLELTAKHTPGFNFLVKEFNDIARATSDNLSNVKQYGIDSAAELANAKALQTGRLMMGSSLISLTAWQWMNGNITGNGPIDRTKRENWKKTGYIPRSIKIGGVWMSYDSIEPFNQILSMVADIGDASELMGEEWTQDNLLKVALLLSQGVTSKSYLAGMQQFVDLVGGRPGQAGRIASSLLNNQIPMAGLRNDLGKIFTPHTRELNSGIADAIRNRNLLTEHIAAEPLAIKYDILRPNTPVKEWDFMTRVFNNLLGVVQFNLDQGPGRTFYHNSGHDSSTAFFYAPDGTDLTKMPHLRSRWQYHFGLLDTEKALDKIATDPRALASLAMMKMDLRNGNRAKFEARDYYHIALLDELFRNNKRMSWQNMLQNEEGVRDLALQQKKEKYERSLKLYQSSQSILAMQPK